MIATDILRVLCVDDNRALAETMSSLLNILGYDADAYFDGESALAAARDFPADAYILDIQMRGMDGCELAEQIRSEFGAHPLLIAVSGWADEVNKHRLAQAGFNHVFTKPANPRLVIAALSEFADQELAIV